MRLTINRNFLKQFFFIVVLSEIFLGGGGRLIDTGSLSIRMFLFICSLLLCIFLLIYGRSIDKNILWLSLACTITLILGGIVGLLNGHDVLNILIDIKPLIYFYSIFYFYLSINSIDDIELIVRTLRRCSLILGVLYLILFFLIHFRLIPFDKFYAWASLTQEFFFRGEFAFFYKGFLY